MYFRQETISVGHLRCLLESKQPTRSDCSSNGPDCCYMQDEGAEGCCDLRILQNPFKGLLSEVLPTIFQQLCVNLGLHIDLPEFKCNFVLLKARGMAASWQVERERERTTERRGEIRAGSSTCMIMSEQAHQAGLLYSWFSF